MRISDWSSDVCSSDLKQQEPRPGVDPIQTQHAGNQVARTLRFACQYRVGTSCHVKQMQDERVPSFVTRCIGFGPDIRSEEHTSELQSLMRISYAVFCLKTKNKINSTNHEHITHKHTH